MVEIVAIFDLYQFKYIISNRRDVCLRCFHIEPHLYYKDGFITDIRPRNLIKNIK